MGRSTPSSSECCVELWRPLHQGQKLQVNDIRVTFAAWRSHVHMEQLGAVDADGAGTNHDSTRRTTGPIGGCLGLADSSSCTERRCVR